VRRLGGVPADQVLKPSVSGGNRPAAPHGGPVLGPPIALGYVRRSKESGARTVSLEDQRARIEVYCQERGWRLTEVLADDGVSGGRRARLDRLPSGSRLRTPASLSSGPSLWVSVKLLLVVSEDERLGGSVSHAVRLDDDPVLDLRARPRNPDLVEHGLH